MNNMYASTGVAHTVFEYKHGLNVFGNLQRILVLVICHRQIITVLRFVAKL
jgi:hypothetical protein